MAPILLALAGASLTAPASNRASLPAQAPLQSNTLERAPALGRSIAAERVADWVRASRDNRGLPYIIVDKVTASLVLFDGAGNELSEAPVLIGVAVGDDATPGIGSKNLSEIGPAEKTTPAGRFLAKFGLTGGKKKILWVDYATSVALHPIPMPAKKSEHRRERMLSPTPDDNRITFGCINVPAAFYARSVRTLFSKKGGYVYVLPDTKPLETVFPRLRVQAVVDAKL